MASRTLHTHRRRWTPVLAALLTVAALTTLAAPAHAQSALSAGSTCSGQPSTFHTNSIFADQSSSSALFCAGPASQDVWVTVTNTGPVAVPFACPSTSTASNCTYTSGAGNNWSSAVATGVAATVAVPSGSYLALNPGIAQDGFNTQENYSATITGVFPQSGGQALAGGESCSGANWIPASVNCIWSGQFGTVTANSWVTFSNTGSVAAELSYFGLSGNGDKLTLQPGQLGYIGLGAGHSNQLQELQLQQQPSVADHCEVLNTTQCTPPSPASPAASLATTSSVPQNFGGFSLQDGSSCQTTSYNVSTVNCAESGQMGVLSQQTSLDLINPAGPAGNSVKVSASGASNNTTVAPGDDGTISFPSGAQVQTQCVSSGSSCPTGTPAEVVVNGLESAGNAATLTSSTASAAGGAHAAASGSAGRVNAPLRCLAPRHRRCQGTIKLSVPARGRRDGPTVDKATFDLAARKSGKVALDTSARLRRGVGELTVKTLQRNGRRVITDRRRVTLKD